MRIGLVTDGLPELPFDDLPRTAVELGVETLEFGCGNWSGAPHLDLDAMLGSERARDTFLGRIEVHGLAISALNCSGNPLHPGSIGEAHRVITSKTMALAGMLGVRRVVMMSGCAGGAG
jgi:sugar phosphate isomerase/epimerase